MRNWRLPSVPGEGAANQGGGLVIPGARAQAPGLGAVSRYTITPQENQGNWDNPGFFAGEYLIFSPPMEIIGGSKRGGGSRGPFP